MPHNAAALVEPVPVPRTPVVRLSAAQVRRLLADHRASAPRHLGAGVHDRHAPGRDPVAALGGHRHRAPDRHRGRHAVPVKPAAPRRRQAGPADRVGVARAQDARQPAHPGAVAVRARRAGRPSHAGSRSSGRRSWCSDGPTGRPSRPTGSAAAGTRRSLPRGCPTCRSTPPGTPPPPCLDDSGGDLRMVSNMLGHASVGRPSTATAASPASPPRRRPTRWIACWARTPAERMWITPHVGYLTRYACAVL